LVSLVIITVENAFVSYYSKMIVYKMTGIFGTAKWNICRHRWNNWSNDGCKFYSKNHDGIFV